MESRLSIRVRHSELDSFAHVNNAVYFNYFEEARWKLLAEMGWTMDRLRKEGLGIVLMECSVRFRKPLLAGDEIEVVTATKSTRAAAAVWSQVILRKGEAVATGDFTAVFVSAPDFHPVRIPEALREAMESRLSPTAGHWTDGGGL